MHHMVIILVVASAILILTIYKVQYVSKSSTSFQQYKNNPNLYALLSGLLVFCFLAHELKVLLLFRQPRFVQIYPYA